MSNKERPRGKAVVDEMVFEDLVTPHLDHLYRVAFRFTGIREEAEDLLQDLLIRLYPRRSELAEVEKLRPWLARVLYRLFVDRIRAAGRSPVDTRDFDAQVDDQLDAAPGPDQVTEMVLTRERLQRALADLSLDQRILLSLHDIEGYTLSELVEILDAPIGTLKSRLNRARTRVRESVAMEPFRDPRRVMN
jgi:RNA polymerase sigma-70 factor (ECF subfamily)